MHFHKLELQLSNAPGFRLGNLLPFADFCLNDFMCSTALDDDVVEKWNRAPATVLRTFCRPHRPKVLRPPQFFKFMSSPTWWWCGWHMNSGSRYSLGHLLPTSSSKSAPTVTVFFTIFMWNRALATVRCTFCRPHLPKAPRTRQIFNDRYMKLKPSSRYSPAHFLSTTLPDRAPQLRKLRPFGNHGSHLIYPKRCRASRPRIHAFPISHTPQLILTWWCGGHDDWSDETELSLQSRAPFSNLIFQKCSHRNSFLRFLYEIELSLQSRAPFPDLIFQKCSEPSIF